MGGKPRSPVRNLISGNEGGVRLASHTCTKTGDNIVTVLQAKHAPLRAGVERQVSVMPRLQEYEQAPDPHPILPLSISNNTTEFSVVLVF